MTYRTIAASETTAQKPVTTTLMTALAQNLPAVAAGETDAIIAQSGWHAYNKIVVGDVNDGVIYDHSVDGTVANIVTPDFVDGYEYICRLDNVSPSSASVTLYVEEYLETSATYDAPIALGSVISAGASVDAAYPSILGGDAALQMQRVPTLNNKSEKILRYRFSWSSGNIDGGTVYLYRRREYISA